MAKIKEFTSCIGSDVNQDHNDLFQGENGYVAYVGVRCNVENAIGAYAFVVYHNGEAFSKREQAYQETTCNRLTLRAIIDSIKTCPEGSYVTVYTKNDCCIATLRNEDRRANGDLYIQFYKAIENIEGVRVVFADRNFQPEQFDELRDIARRVYRQGEYRRDRLER